MSANPGFTTVGSRDPCLVRLERGETPQRARVNRLPQDGTSKQRERTPNRDDPQKVKGPRLNPFLLFYALLWVGYT